MEQFFLQTLCLGLDIVAVKLSLIYCYDIFQDVFIDVVFVKQFVTDAYTVLFLTIRQLTRHFAEMQCTLSFLLKFRGIILWQCSPPQQSLGFLQIIVSYNYVDVNIECWRGHLSICPGLNSSSVDALHAVNDQTISTTAFASHRRFHMLAEAFVVVPVTFYRLWRQF